MKYLLLGFFVAVSLLSCNTTTDPDTGDPSDVIVPMKVGNLWIYESKEFDSSGTVLLSSIDTAMVVGEITIAGETWALFANLSSDTISARNKSNGLYWVYRGVERQVYLYPAKPGDRYFSRHDTVDNGERVISDIVDVETINSNVTTPAGTFSCIKYASKHEELTIASGYIWTAPYTMVDYVCPNKGHVQMTETFRDLSGKTWVSRQRTLISISLK